MSSIADPLSRAGRPRIDRQVIRRIAADALGERISVAVERVEEGISTLVYRLRRGTEAFYLRVLPEPGASFAPEAFVLALLRSRGLHVPEVVHLEECNETLQRSVMVTTEIRGRPVGHLPPGDAARDVFMAAGRELAILNSVPVAGFGWIRREAGSAAGLRAEMPSNRAFLLEHLDQYLSTLDAGVLTPEEVRAIRQVIDARVACLDTQHAHLAHGDFDLTHIYEEHGRYTGIIDFGEIRGTGPWYDLGHFRLHDGETAPYEALPHLLAGFRQVEPLPPCSEHDIAFLSLLVGIRFLARGLNRLAKRTRSHAQQSIRRDLALLSDGM